jgi:hypothetical protein
MAPNASREQYLFLAQDCPNGHRPNFKFTHTQMRALLENGTLMFYCAVCKLKFPPSGDAIENLRKEVRLS